MISKPFPIVAFGASAGGINAFTALLANLDPNLGMAYVLIMHLSPNHKSALAEIVQSKTRMTVHTVKDGMEVLANNVYVIPPKTFMSLVDGHLKLAPRSSSSIGNFAVDYFFIALASIYKNNAIGVILSGTATDGTLGLKAIKAEGGITFAQDETAEFNGMPQSAIDSGYVDFKLAPEAIAVELGRLTKLPYTTLPSDKIDVVSVEEVNGHGEDLRKILALVRDQSGVDFFNHYKQASIYRRVMRRMVLNQFDKLSDYRQMLKVDRKEVEALFDDFLINVTHFFRDPDFYKALSKRIFPAITRTRKPDVPIRIWVAGCATGEEAYSIAICLKEFLTQKKLSLQIQIFASDLDADAIEKARPGIYPASALEGVPEKYVKGYFKKINSNYQVVKSVREVCVFAHHNLLKDPPFSRMDLISCQNVLIYLESNPQKKVLQTFHYALAPKGYLFLAKSETVGSSTDLFESLDKRLHYYAKKPVTPQPMAFTMHMTGRSSEESIRRTGQQDEPGIEKEMEKMMLSRFVYPGVVVNKQHTITQFFGETSPYLAPARGKASLNVLKMIREDLIIDLRSLLQKAQKSEMSALKKGVKIYNKGVSQQLTIEVVPKKTAAGLFFLVVFKEDSSGESLSSKPARSTGTKEKTILNLEAELVQSREVIRTTNEEYETTYEELQANNEEILSSNEELQSVNEELETSREELQSSNEELTTINEELNKRNVELKESQDYTEAIIETIHGPLLVLDSNFQVRRANNMFYQSFHMSKERTEGVLLYDLGDGSWDIPELRGHMKNVNSDGPVFKSFELKYFFPGLGERDLIINAYRLLKDKGPRETLILLAFDDFTRTYNAETLLFKTQEQLKLSLIGDSIGTWWWDLQTGEMKWSKENEALNGLESGTFPGNHKDWQSLIHPDDLAALDESIQTAIRKSIEKPGGRQALELEYRVIWPDGGVHWILSKGNIYADQNHKPERVVGVSIDNTKRKLNSQILEREVKMRTAELTDANNSLVVANEQLEQFVFISSHDLQEPLRKIQTFTNFIAADKGALTLNADKYIQKINASISRMSTLLNDLFSFSMLKEDVAQHTQVDLNSVLAQLVRHFDGVIAAKEATINLASLPVIQANPVQMSQLFYHLVDNALKFSKEKPVIDISAREVTEKDFSAHHELNRNTTYVAVSVRDNGIGFDQKYVSKIFTVFQQLRDISAAGTGIGLAICKKIMQNHRGLIVADGKVNAGATVTVFLPAG